MSRVDELTQGTLKELVEEFTSQNRSLDELRHEYVGVSMITLKAKLCGDGMARDIDFDLALKDLIDKKLVGTGPLAVIESPEISGG